MSFLVPVRYNEKGRLSMEKADNVSWNTFQLLKLVDLGSWSFVHCNGHDKEEEGGAEGGGNEAKVGGKLSQWN